MFQTMLETIYVNTSTNGVQFILFTNCDPLTENLITNILQNNLYDLVTLVNRKLYIFSKPNCGIWFKRIVLLDFEKIVKCLPVSSVSVCRPGGLPLERPGWSSGPTDCYLASLLA